MKIHWKKLFFSLVLWFVAEICLTILGLDDLADYSEFILNKEVPGFIGWREVSNPERVFRYASIDNSSSFFKMTA